MTFSNSAIFSGSFVKKLQEERFSYSKNALDYSKMDRLETWSLSQMVSKMVSKIPKLHSCEVWSLVVWKLSFRSPQFASLHQQPFSVMISFEGQGFERVYSSVLILVLALSLAR